MKNLFKTLVAGMLLLAGASASAGTLYWQVTADTGKTFGEAWLVAEAKEGGALSYIEGVDSDGQSPSSTALTQTDISAYEGDGYLFYVEMCNYNSATGDYDPVATGYKYSYDELVSSGYVAASPLEVNDAIAAASGANFGSPIPEPSSGLLLLIGGAMLALRRRRQK
jgi:hypothetical protein